MHGRGEVYLNNGTLLYEVYFINGKLRNIVKKTGMNNNYNIEELLNDQYHGNGEFIESAYY